MLCGENKGERQELQTSSDISNHDFLFPHLTDQNVQKCLQPLSTSSNNYWQEKSPELSLCDLNEVVISMWLNISSTQGGNSISHLVTTGNLQSPHASSRLSISSGPGRGPPTNIEEETLVS